MASRSIAWAESFERCRAAHCELLGADSLNRALVKLAGCVKTKSPMEDPTPMPKQVPGSVLDLGAFNVFCKRALAGNLEEVRSL